MAINFGSMMGGQSGWSRLGSSLGDAMSGGAQRTYDDTMLRGHRVQRALMDAKQATMKYNAMADLEDTLRDALPEDLHGYTPYIAAAQRGGVNPVQGLQAPREGIRSSALSRAMQQAEAGDPDSMNRFISVAQQSPMRQAQVSGNMLFNPNVSPEAQTPILTDYGAGQLSNQAERTRGLNAASMASATRPRGGASSGGGDNQLSAMLDAAAKDAFRGARADGADLYGITEADIRWQLENRGEAKDANGRVIARFERPQDVASAGMDGVSPISSPSAAMSGAPVTEPQGQSRGPEPVSGDGDQLPPQARAALTEGENVTFANGQTWTLRDGTPVRVF